MKTVDLELSVFPLYCQQIMTSFSSPFSFRIPYCFPPLFYSHEILVVAVVVHFSHALLLLCEMCSVRVFLRYFSAEESDNVLVKS